MKKAIFKVKQADGGGVIIFILFRCSILGSFFVSLNFQPTPPGMTVMKDAMIPCGPDSYYAKLFVASGASVIPGRRSVVRRYK